MAFFSSVADDFGGSVGEHAVPMIQTATAMQQAVLNVGIQSDSVHKLKHRDNIGQAEDRHAYDD